MKYNKYIVSFVAGSSGRFVVQVLDRILLQKKDLITITQYNSAHANDIYTGHSIGEPHHPKVFEILKFDSPSIRSYPFSNILSTHVYPNFKVINSRFDDVGVILIRPEVNDAKEIVFNSWYKNRNIIRSDNILENIEKKEFYKILENMAKKTSLDNIKFFSSDEYPNNCLVIKYKELYQIENDKHTILEKLKKFTGIEEVPDIAVTACNQYIEGRDRLTKQFNLR